MAINKQTALDRIDAILKEDFENANRQHRCSELITRLCAVIKDLSPPGSQYLAQMDRALNQVFDVRRFQNKDYFIMMDLEGVVRALRADYDAGHLQSFQELVHADLFSDFLEMAEYFLDEGYKDPAAVMAGGVLEEHLRKLCGKHLGTISARPKLDTMNTDLAKASAYGKNEQKQVTAWAGIRNDAAHGNYGNYTNDQVKLMVAGIRDFLTRNPA
jgi:hypothetical protein